jgi:hypothetical protein
MSDNSEAPSHRKFGFLGPLAIALVAAAVVLIATLNHAPPEPAPKPAPPPAPAPVQAPPKLVPEPPLDRAALIAIGRRAADAYEAGEPPGKDALVGRRFVVRLPFGCNGPQTSSGSSQAAYSYDPGRKSLRITVRAASWQELPQIQSLPDAGDLEAVQGFWLRRPWSTSETCPSARTGPPPAAPTPPSRESLGLATLFEAGGSRVLRQGDRPYEVVRKVGEKDADLVNHSYRLVLEGRISGFADGQAARCWSESPDQRPVCLIGVTIERLAIEDGQTGESLGEWRN